VALLLRAGLLVGGLLILVGLVLAVFEGRLRSHPVALGEVAGSLATGRPSAFMAAGILVLVTTPLARVATLAVEFLREGDRRFALVALAVAAILVAGIAAGRI
jgi:uncharacterized membrane protein